MQQQKYNVIGVMSGTSLDGIDLAHIHFTIIDNFWTFEILESETVQYNQDWISELKKAVDFSTNELKILNTNYTELLGTVIFDFIKKYKISNLDAVCSHGHTILHQPQKGITLQIGNLPKIASICKQTVVCNFRIQDVLLGGQGAPLVPIGDQILFSEYDYCLNLGGFSNISFESNKKRIAFDISPVNTVLNYYSNKLGLEYDDKGQISRSGKINETLLKELNTIDFYKLSFPKSLGFEFVKGIVLPIIENHSISIEDKMRTFTEHIAQQIGLALNSFSSIDKNGKLLITGGGAYNDFLIERTQYYLPKTSIVIPDSKLLEYKEALIFALLGVLKLRNEINVLSSVTGSNKDHCSGYVYNSDEDLDLKLN